MLKILCIGNSFSQDASRYVWGVARDAGKQVKIVNLYIGGCTLALHYRNMLSEKPAYAFEINGMTKTGVYISMKDALLSDEWDVITVQQQSLAGAYYDSFVPYLEELLAYVRRHAPKARIYMHSTWGYKPDSEKLANTEFADHKAMYEAIRDTYRLHGEEQKTDGIIDGGLAVLLANERQMPHIYKDEYHMSRGFGRLMQALLWCGFLLGTDPLQSRYSDTDEELTEEELIAAREIAAEVLKGSRSENN